MLQNSNGLLQTQLSIGGGLFVFIEIDSQTRYVIFVLYSSERGEEKLSRDHLAVDMSTVLTYNSVVAAAASTLGGMDSIKGRRDLLDLRSASHRTSDFDFCSKTWL